jgi:hypothetical protein
MVRHELFVLISMAKPVLLLTISFWLSVQSMFVFAGLTPKGYTDQLYEFHFVRIGAFMPLIAYLISMSIVGKKEL